MSKLLTTRKNTSTGLNENLSEITKWQIVICGLLIYPSFLTHTREMYREQYGE